MQEAGPTDPSMEESAQMSNEAGQMGSSTLHVTSLSDWGSGGASALDEESGAVCLKSQPGTADMSLQLSEPQFHGL